MTTMTLFVVDLFGNGNSNSSILYCASYNQPGGASNICKIAEQKVFKWCLKVVVDDRVSFSSVGGRFHARGGATEWTVADSPLR